MNEESGTEGQLGRETGDEELDFVFTEDDACKPRSRSVGELDARMLVGRKKTEKLDGTSLAVKLAISDRHAGTSGPLDHHNTISIRIYSDLAN